MTTQSAMPPQCSPEQVTQSLVEYVRTVETSADQAVPSIRSLLLRHDLTLLAPVALIVSSWPLLYDTVIEIPSNLCILLVSIALIGSRIAYDLDKNTIKSTLLQRTSSAKSVQSRNEGANTIKLLLVIFLIAVNIIGMFLTSARASDHPQPYIAPSDALSAHRSSEEGEPQRPAAPKAARLASHRLPPAASKPPDTYLRPTLDANRHINGGRKQGQPMSPLSRIESLINILSFRLTGPSARS